MKLSFALPAIALVALACLAGCNPSGGSTGPDASAGGTSAPPEQHPLGLNVNSQYETATLLAELHVVAWGKSTADVTADAATAETVFGGIGPGPTSIPIGSVVFNPLSALTANDGNNAVLSVYKHQKSDAGAQVLIASAYTNTKGLDGGTGNWTAFVPVPFTVVPGAYLSPGDIITVAITKGSGGSPVGVVVPQGQLLVFTTLQ